MHTARVLRAEDEPASRKHHAQTTGKRFARLRNVPPELLPLAVVLALGVGAGVFSMGRALLSDPTVPIPPIFMRCPDTQEANHGS
ncbi:protein of unknown function [Taphrina deformans PYCC 5710]|uniref:Uncharacterized protein n=1 Tax=Taphrina deformans (strain PYCC 5710 / ATCC 11124 / CBS 356.35 / IMI 108563 / JCM 9778 / NBRC 8474) TaxID=1097556 RepID=R4X6F2_TAPDE|nr:protein of unknown function [Taphrina deformans PYCC 5710]|eukprot:CCG80640.1 protein of unknown function [Taphrina deformans PYCC 5710]